MLRDLERKFPGHPIHVFSHGFRKLDEPRFAAFKAAAPMFEHVGATYVHAPSRLQRLARPFLPRKVLQAHQVRALAERSTADSARFSSYEAVFLAGGSHWGGSRVGTSMFGTLMAVAAHNDRIYAYPFSINDQVLRDNAAADLRQYFSHLRQPIVVRDGMAGTVMRGLGVPVTLGVDCVFSLQELAGAIEPAATRDPSRVLFVTTAPDKAKLEIEIRDMLQRLRLNRPITLLTTCESEDGQAFRHLSSEFGAGYLAPSTWQETVAELKASSLVVTNRLHGLILGCLADTPLLPVTDRKKSEAFVSDARMPHSAPTIGAISDDLLERCMGDRRSVLDAMRRYKSYAVSAARAPI
jgi:polysaccharide pyruvyl transferase WcaK-like protein